LIYTFIYLTLHWFTHSEQRKAQNLTIYANPTSSELAKENIYQLTTKISI